MPVKTRHHRKPKSRGGNGKKENVILIDDKLHKNYHALFRNMTPHEMAVMLNKLIDPEYYFVVRRKK